jgi:4-hydroxybutyrate CoA-transferase
MKWLSDYKAKLRTSAEAVSFIKSGDRVYYGGNAAIPQELVRALAARRAELENVQLNHVLLLGEDPLSAPEMEGHIPFRLRRWRGISGTTPSLWVRRTGRR